MDKQWKLNYKVTGKKKLTVRQIPGATGNGPCSPGAVAGPDLDMELFTIEWTHVDGFPPDMRDVPIRLSMIAQILGALLPYAVKKGVLTQEQVGKTLLLVEDVFPSHPMMTDLGLLKVPDGERAVIMDSLSVRAGTPTSIVMQQCEEKREMLARSIGVEP